MTPPRKQRGRTDPARGAGAGRQVASKTGGTSRTSDADTQAASTTGGGSDPDRQAAGDPQDAEGSGALIPTATAATDTPRQRGRVDIAARVVERVAEAAAMKLPDVRPVSHRIGGDRVQVQARVLGDVASVQMQIAVGYPSPVHQTCQRLRSAVIDDVRRLTGLEVTRLDLQVAELPHRPGGTRRVR